MYKRLFLFSIASFLLVASSVFATTSITSFTASNQSAFSGQLISLSWSGTDVSGYNILVSCASGVKIKKEDGTLFPCETKVATSGQESDSMGFSLINISGSTKNVTFKLYPKSTNGDEVTSGMQIQTVSISPAAAPLTSVTVSATTTTSGSPITVTWASTDLDGVNIILDCVDGVTVSSSLGGTSLPCGTLAFSEKLAESGSQSFYFKNPNNDKTSMTLRVLPYIGDGAYDSTHSLSASFDVASDKVLPFQILTFTPSQPKIASGDTLTLLWTTKYANGVNLKMDCVDSLSFNLATTSGGQTINCNSLVTDSYFGPNSSAGVVINNSSKDTKTAYISLLALLPNGGFDGINVRKIAVQVLPKGETVIFNGTTVTPVVTTSATTNTTQTGKKIISPRKKFLKILTFGVKSDDVSALQEFLYKNGYYPEGLITGYMGALTTKAVQRFQEQNGVVKAGGVGYGNVGPATRAKLNSL